MQFLYLLENIRMPGLNEFMLGITYFGDEIAFLVTAMIVFWCIDKRMGYYVMSVGFVGTISNQFMKLCFCVPRPWVKDPEFLPLGNAMERATGYSFPSGHTQNAVGTFGSIAYALKNKSVRVICLTLTVLVPFSRMYIGVHTPMDIIVAAITAVVLIFSMRPLMMGNDGKRIPWVLLGMSILAVGFMCFVLVNPMGFSADDVNYQSGLKNAFTLTGALFGMLVVYFVDTRWLNFPTKAVWWVQIIKVVIGLMLVLAVKSGLKAPINFIFGELVGRCVRYFLIVVVAGIVWPLSFKKLSKIGKKD